MNEEIQKKLNDAYKDQRKKNTDATTEKKMNEQVVIELLIEAQLHRYQDSWDRKYGNWSHYALATSGIEGTRPTMADMESYRESIKQRINEG